MDSFEVLLLSAVSILAFTSSLVVAGVFGLLKTPQRTWRTVDAFILFLYNYFAVLAVIVIYKKARRQEGNKPSPA